MMKLYHPRKYEAKKPRKCHGISSRVNPYCAYKDELRKNRGKSGENTVWPTDREQYGLTLPVGFLLK